MTVFFQSMSLKLKGHVHTYICQGTECLKSKIALKKGRLINFFLPTSFLTNRLYLY